MAGKFCNICLVSLLIFQLSQYTSTNTRFEVQNLSNNYMWQQRNAGYPVIGQRHPRNIFCQNNCRIKCEKLGIGTNFVKADKILKGPLSCPNWRQDKSERSAIPWLLWHGKAIRCWSYYISSCWCVPNLRCWLYVAVNALTDCVFTRLLDWISTYWLRIHFFTAYPFPECLSTFWLPIPHFLNAYPLLNSVSTFWLHIHYSKIPRVRICIFQVILNKFLNVD